MTAYRFLLFLFALLLTGGMYAPAAAQDDPMRPNERVQKQTPPSALKQDKKIEDAKLPPLWEKLKPSNWMSKPADKQVDKQKNTRKTEAPLWDGGADAADVKKETPQKTKVVQSAVPPVAPPPVLEIADAPLPPQTPYYDNIGKQTAAANVPKFDGSAVLAEQEIVQHDPFSSDVPEEAPHAGVSSYAFDTRDWVESFPVEHLEVKNEAPAEKSKAKNEKLTAENVPQKERTAPPATSADTQWDGQAVDVVNYQRTNINSATPATPPTPAPVIAEKAAAEAALKVASLPAAPVARPLSFDLEPSYSKHLPHSAVLGVVVVQANFPLTEIQPMLEEISMLQRDLNLYIGVPAAKEKIELCLFSDEKSYQHFLRTVFPNAPRDRRALYIKLDKKPGVLLVQKTEDFEIDLRHEMTHAIIHTSINYVPIWLDEGLAKYFEVPIQDRAAENPYMRQIRWNTKFGAVPPLSRLEKLQDISQMGSKEYRDSWAWVHFLIHYSPQTHRLLASYLQLLSTLSDQQKTAQSKSKTLQIPPLEAYLQDTVQNPKERYREHFNGTVD